MLRTYALPHQANAAKLKKLQPLLIAYRKAAESIAAQQWRAFFEYGEVFQKNAPIRIDTPLSARYRQTCQYQVVGLLKSFIKNRQNDFRRLVARSRLPEDIRHQLYTVNSLMAWYRPSPVMMQDQTEISPDVRRLARCLMRRLLSQHSKPCMGRINLALDAKVAQVSYAAEGRGKGKARHFDYWIKLSTLETGKPIHIPLSTHRFFDSRVGDLKAFVQINQCRGGQWQFALVKEIADEKSVYRSRCREIGLDFGLNILFATSEGDLMGQGFITRLRILDEALTKLARRRQKQGLRVRCTRYDRLTRRLQSFVRNEVNRVLNRILLIHAPGHLVVERLNFQNAALSRRMNRLLSRCGRQAVRAKLEEIEERLGVTHEERPAAYTSQECAACGYVDRRNRKDRDRFECGFCQTHKHADVNGAQSLVGRGSADTHKDCRNPFVSRKQILQVLVQRFASRLEQRPGNWPRPRSWASTLSTNPYYQGVSARCEHKPLERL